MTRLNWLLYAPNGNVLSYRADGHYQLAPGKRETGRRDVAPHTLSSGGWRESELGRYR